MGKKRSAAKKATRRSRGEIDRNYFFGDLFIKMGAANFVVIGVLCLFGPSTLIGGVHEQMTAYYAMLFGFAAAGLGCFAIGRHLRKTATHWDFD